MTVKERSFWSTIPGLVTGLAGLLTGIVGLLTVAVQLGWIGSDDDDSSKQTDTTAPATAGNDGGPGTTVSALLGGGARSATTAPSAGGLTVEPASVTFPAVGSREEVVTVRNATNAAIALRAPTISGVNANQFTATNVDCGTSLAAGRSCSVKVTFAASRGGESTANLVIQPANGPAREVPLVGRTLL
jgi:hypothetical protein